MTALAVPSKLLFDATISIVPRADLLALSFMLTKQLELLKNSMRATVEYHGVDADYPPIKVVIADGSDNEDVIIKVSDEGGGIPRSNMKRIWSYVSSRHVLLRRCFASNGRRLAYKLVGRCLPSIDTAARRLR